MMCKRRYILRFFIILAIIVFAMPKGISGNSSLQQDLTPQPDESKFVYRNFLPITSTSSSVTDRFTTYTRSYYITTTIGFYNLGQAIGNYAMSVAHPDTFFTYLSFGCISRNANGDYGTNIYDGNLTFYSTYQISSLIIQLANGFSSKNTKDKLYIAVGTNNSGDHQLYSYTAYGHGKAWANMIKEINQTMIEEGISYSRVEAVAGNDIEPGFNNFSDTKLWFDGYNSVSSPPAMYIIGSADGCPSDYPEPDPGSGYFQPAMCNNGWSQENINFISNHYPKTYSIPMNYNTLGVNASQWWRIGLWSYYSYSSDDKLSFSGVMTQEAACQQIREETGDPNTCAGTDNTMQQGFSQFSNLVKGEYRMNPFLNWAADMKWYKGAP